MLTRSSLNSGGTSYPTLGLWVGSMDHPDAIRVDVSGLTADEVDASGFIKPGVPLKATGTLADGTADEVIHGAVLEPVKVASGNGAAALAAAADVDVTVGTIGQLNRAATEDTIGRALSASEVAAFGRSLIHLV